MAKVGYIFKADRYDGFEADKEWMQKYGCVQVIEELVENEALRPRWKQLVANLERGDEIVVAKFSNALRGSRELSAFIELCRIKVVRIISIHDRIDSRGKLFPETTAASRGSRSPRERPQPMYWICSGRYPKRWRYCGIRPHMS